MAIVQPQTFRLEPIDSLLEHPRNPRRGNEVAIETSIRQNGFYGFVVAQTSTRFILVGNHRWRSARMTGVAEIPTLWLDISDVDALRIMLADNRVNDLATNDPAELLAILESMTSTEGTLYEEGHIGQLRKLMELEALEKAGAAADRAADHKVTCPECGLAFEPS